MSLLEQLLEQYPDASLHAASRHAARITESEDWHNRGYTLSPDNYNGEAYFEPQDCELCHEDPGLRYLLIAHKSNDDQYMLDVCESCLLFIANGDMPKEML